MLLLPLPPSLQIPASSHMTNKEKEKLEMEMLVVVLICKDCIYADGIHLLLNMVAQ